MSTPPSDEDQPTRSPSLSSLIASRICHDLISPIGAITNGLELLALSGRAASPEMELIEDSVVQATARIKFFRLAFGPTNASPQSFTEVDELLRGFENGGRIKITMDSQGEVARERLRLILLALLCLERAMPTGGEITIRREDATWLVEGQADRLQTTEAVWHHLVYGTAFDDLRPATVQYSLLREGAADLGVDLRVSISSDMIAIRI